MQFRLILRFFLETSSFLVKTIYLGHFCALITKIELKKQKLLWSRGLIEQNLILALVLDFEGWFLEF